MKRMRRATVLLLALTMVTVYSAMVFAEEGDMPMQGDGTFSTQKEAETWQTEINQYFGGLNTQQSDYTYTVNWSGIEETSVKRAAGEPITTPFGPYDTEEAAKSALDKARMDDPSNELHEAAFSEISQGQAGVGEGESKTFDSNPYNSAEERDSALAEKKRELQERGCTDISSSCSQTEGTVIGVEIKNFSKEDYSAASYTVPAGSYIVVKQSGCYIIWTPEDMSAYADTFREFVNEKDSSTRGKSFCGMVTGFEKDFEVTQSSGVYSVKNNGDGTYTLRVSSADKISHMDYGSYIMERTGITYSFTISYTMPAEMKEAWYFTKTVQEYQWKKEYKVSYTAAKDVRPLNPNPDPEVPETPVIPHDPYIPLIPVVPEVPIDPQPLPPDEPLIEPDEPTVDPIVPQPLPEDEHLIFESQEAEKNTNPDQPKTRHL